MKMFYIWMYNMYMRCMFLTQACENTILKQVQKYIVTIPIQSFDHWNRIILG